MKKQDIIDEYMLGLLSPEEEKTFRRQLEEDLNLVKDLRRRQSIAQGLKDFNHQKKRKQIVKVRQRILHQPKASKTKTIRNNKLKIFLAAASVSILTLLIWLMLSHKTPDYQQLFAQHFEVYDLSFVTRELDGIEKLILAEKYYDRQNYNAAIPLLKQATSDHPANPEIELSLGNAYLAEQQTDLAIPYFTAIIQRNDPLYIDYARWYLALCHLNKQQLSRCESLLKQLSSNPTNDFYEEAKALLNGL